MSAQGTRVPGRSQRGAGSASLAAMRRKGARRIYVDTSSSAKYESTRAFYKRNGYKVGAELPDFYRDGDGKVIFVKDLAS